jgi:hypothetical protein
VSLTSSQPIRSATLAPISNQAPTEPREPSTMKRSALAACAALLAGLLVGQSVRAADPAAPNPAAASAHSADPAAPSVPDVREDTSARTVPERRASGSSPNGAAGWTLVGASGALAVGAAIFGVMALQAQSDFQNTSLERAASDASDRYTRDTAAFAASTTVALVAALVGTYLLLQSDGESRALAAPVGIGHTGFALLF